MEITTHIQFALPSKPTLRVKSLFPSLVLSGTGLLPSMAAKWLSIIPMVLTDLQELGLAHDFTRPYKLYAYRIQSLGSSRFARRYSGNPFWFLFLPLMICLSLGGRHGPRMRLVIVQARHPRRLVTRIPSPNSL
jgi:hypothetical protein